MQPNTTDQADRVPTEGDLAYARHLFLAKLAEVARKQQPTTTTKIGADLGLASQIEKGLQPLSEPQFVKRRRHGGYRRRKTKK